MKRTLFYKQTLISLAISFFLIIAIPGFLEAYVLIWTVVVNPSTSWDQPFAITSDNTYIYVAGFDCSFGISRWRIEKRRKDTGVLEPGWPVYGVKGISRAITSDNTYIYVAGGDNTISGNTQWRIEKIRKDTGASAPGWPVTIDPSTYNDSPYAITSDDTYIYVAGSHVLGINASQWHIEKIRKDTGASASGWPVLIDPSPPQTDTPYAITSDDTYIYVAGYDYAIAGDGRWRIEKIRKDTGASAPGWPVTSVNGTQTAYAITSDATYIYVAGNDDVKQWRIDKRRKDTGVLEPGWPVTSGTGSKWQDKPNSITSDDTYLYVAGYDNLAITSDWLAMYESQWRVEKRRKDTGALEPGWPLTFNPSSGDDSACSITSDDTFIYVAGYDYLVFDKYNTDSRWRIEKRAKAATDIGLRVFIGTEPVGIAAQPAGTVTSPLRITKGGATYGVALVEPGDSNDSGVRIQTNSGTKTLGKIPEP